MIFVNTRNFLYKIQYPGYCGYTGLQSCKQHEIIQWPIYNLLCIFQWEHFKTYDLKYLAIFLRNIWLIMRTKARKVWCTGKKLKSTASRNCNRCDVFTYVVIILFILCKYVQLTLTEIIMFRYFVIIQYNYFTIKHQRYIVSVTYYHLHLWFKVLQASRVKNITYILRELCFIWEHEPCAAITKTMLLCIFFNGLHTHVHVAYVIYNP